MWFTRISISNPVLATMMMAAFLVLGLFSYQRLSIDQFPDVTFPVVVVQTEYPGASPEGVETDVTRKIEESVNTISGVKTLSSRSYEGRSVVIVEFDLTINPAVAAQDVREKVAIVKAAFRKEVKEPRISRFNPDDLPILSVAVRGEGKTLRELTTLADQVIKKRIENARGVGQAVIVGGVKREIQIFLKPAEMEALGVGVDQVINAIRAENQELPAGSLITREREQLVQVQGRIARPDQFRSVIVARRGGQPVQLSQVANVVDGQEEEENIAIVRVGQEVSFKVEGFGERAFSGRIDRINPSAQSGTRSIVVYAVLSNRDGALKGGMFAKGSLTVSKRDNAIVLPVSALRGESGTSLVWRLDGGRLVPQPVTTGMRNDDQGLVEIVSGLEPGTTILKSNLGMLRAGAEVKITQPR